MKFTAVQKRAMRVDPKGFALSLSRTDLKEVLDELDHRYYTLDDSPVPDEAYDIMHDVYFKGKKKTAKSVGGTKSADVTLEVPMNSLEKFKTLSQPRQNSFLSAVGFVISDKEDGISLAITYDGGVPVLATTRGEQGLVGKDVSRMIPLFKIPKKIPYKQRFIVRAEFTVDKATFQKYFAAEYKTGRNMAGGMLNRNEANPHIKKFRVICYEILKGKSAGGKLSVQLDTLGRYEFDVVPHRVVKKITDEALAAYHDQRKKESGRDIDGIVVFQDKPYTIKPGYPSYAYAYKINSLANSVLVTVKDVVWEESRHGRWQPRILIEPTIIGGVEVSYFTGHSAFYIEHGYKQLKKGEKAPYKPRPLNKGAQIRAVRSGDVIPFIMEVVKGAKTPSVPPGPHVRQGVHWRVAAGTAGKSDTRLVKELVHFFEALETDGMKEGSVKALVASGFDTVKKIMRMEKAQFQTLPGFAEKSGSQLWANVQKAKKNLTFINVAKGSAAFGEGIGEKRLVALYEAMPNIAEKVEEPEWLLAQDIAQIRGFKKLADQIAANLKTFAKFCKRNGITLTAAKAQEVTGNQMAGQAILFTSVRDKEVEKWILANGGKIASTVKQATALIVKEEGASNNKTAEAEKLGKPIIPLQTFRKKHRI